MRLAPPPREVSTLALAVDRVNRQSWRRRSAVSVAQRFSSDLTLNRYWHSHLRCACVDLVMHTFGVTSLPLASGKKATAKCSATLWSRWRQSVSSYMALRTSGATCRPAHLWRDVLACAPLVRPIAYAVPDRQRSAKATVGAYGIRPTMWAGRWGVEVMRVQQHGPAH